MKEDKTHIEELAIDALIEKPITFTLDGRFFYVYQPSIGVSAIGRRILSALSLDENIKMVNYTFALIEVVKRQKNDVLRYIAIHTFEHRKDALNEKLVEERVKELESMGIEDVMKLALSIMNFESLHGQICKHYGIDKQQEKRNQISKVKDDSNSLTLGGDSIWGRMIDFACERYGWSVEYVLWGVSATNLNMMMADSITSIYLTDDERKKLHISTDGIVINADDKKNAKQLRNLIKGK